MEHSIKSYTNVSDVISLAENLEIEVVHHGSTKAEKFLVYLDAKHPHPQGNKRPALIVNFEKDGKTVKKITLFQNNNIELEWNR